MTLLNLCRRLVEETLASLIKERKQKKDVKVDPEEEVKDDNHILEVRRREEGYPTRMQTRQSQQNYQSQPI